jgi:hypothetical protein
MYGGIPIGFRQSPVLVQQFPGNAAEWAASWPSVALATSLWTFQEAAFPIADQIAGANALAQGAAGTFTFMYAEDPNGRLGIRALAGSSNARIASAAVFNLAGVGSGIISMYTRFGSIATSATLRRPVCGKRSRVSVAAGYRVVVMPVTGFLRLEVCDGVSEVAVELAEDHGDNGFYNVMAVVDRSAEVATIYSSKSGASASLSIAALGSLSNGLRYCFGEANGVETDTGAVWDYGAVLSGAAWTAGNFATMSGP